MIFKCKDLTCPIQCLKFKASTCRLHFGWECHCHRSKRYPPFESGPPLLGITEVPGVYFFPLLLCVGKFFFFTRAGQVSFFFFPCGSSFFFPLLCVGQVFFFLPLSGSSFFFKNFLLPPPWSLMVRPLLECLCRVHMLLILVWENVWFGVVAQDEKKLLWSYTRGYFCLAWT